ALRGAERVTGLDIDPVAVSAARANVRLNRLGRRVRFHSGGPDAPGTWRRYAPFDLILANITARENSRLAAAYVGLMAPGARLIDVTHEVPSGDVRMGALRLAAAASYFPPGTVHLAVVDPGVGSARRAIALESSGHFFVGPDNGLLRLAAPLISRAVELTNR